jgi:GNAT superfamily N-acetyltransferase
MTFHPTARELRRRLADGGPSGVLAFLAGCVRAQFVKRERLVVDLKQLDEIAVPARVGSLHVEPLEPRHLPALRELNRERGDLAGDARFAADLDAGYRGFAGFRDGRLVACYWWCDASTPPHRDLRRLGLGIELGPKDVYGFDLYVDKRHRAGGTANEMLFRVESALRERGFERLWGWAAEGNRVARWTYSSRGYRSMWMVERTRVLRRWRSRTVTLDAAHPVEAERKRVAA